MLVNSAVFPALAACVRSRHASEGSRARAAAIVGLVLRHATEIDADVNMAEVSHSNSVCLTLSHIEIIAHTISIEILSLMTSLS